MADGLTIGQAAEYADVTIKTIRHYHRLGLLREPPRDSSGYRRYTSVHLLRLVQVRALADAGVALAEIDDLLDADPNRFVAALSEVRCRLDERITELTAHRDTLERLTDKDRALLPDRACAVLDRFREVGFPADYVSSEREGLVLARALAPAFLEGFLTQLEARIDDPDYVELQKRGWEAMAWAPDDPRLDHLATAMAENLLTHRDLMEAQADALATPEALARYRLLNDHRADELPTAARLNALIEDRLREAGLSIPPPGTPTHNV